MADDQTVPSPSSIPPPPDNPQNTKILHKTLAEIIQNNPHAQSLIMKSMGINQQQLKDMVAQASSNPIMNMPVSDLFKNGIMQQAAQQKGMNVSQEQFQQMLNAMNTQNQQNLPNMPQTPTYQMPQNMQGMATPVMIPVGVTQVPINGGVSSTATQPQKKSFLQKLKGLFK